MWLWREDKSNQSTDTTLEYLWGTGTAGQTDSRAAGGTPLFRTDAGCAGCKLLRINRGLGERTEQGLASPTFLPRLPSFTVGKKETGRSWEDSG